jgi:hypothetical protein
MMEAVSTSGTSIKFYEITRRNILADCHFYGNGFSDNMTGWEFIGQLSDCQHIKIFQRDSVIGFATTNVYF